MMSRKENHEFWPEAVNRPHLEPCPICGKPAESWFDFVDLPDDPGGGNGFFVGCRECDIVFHSLWTPDMAAENWNRRRIKERLY